MGTTASSSSHPPGREKSGYHEADRVAHIPQGILYPAPRYWAEFKVMQELMRHSTIRVTLDTYTQAVTSEKRAAQTAVVSLFVRSKKRSKAA